VPLRQAPQSLCDILPWSKFEAWRKATMPPQGDAARSLPGRRWWSRCVGACPCLQGRHQWGMMQAGFQAWLLLQTNQRPKQHSKGLGRKFRNAYTTSKLPVLAKWTHLVHPHNNQGIPGTILAVTITHRMSITMDLIIPRLHPLK